jgi:hypothetical protein
MLQPIYKFFHHHYKTRYHGIYNHAKQLFVLDLILLGTVILLFTGMLFFLFWRPNITDQIELSVSLGNKRIKSGETVYITIDYANNSNSTITNNLLSLKLPSGFVVDTQRIDHNTFNANSTFILKDLAPGAHGQVGIYGKFWATPQQNERILATLTYIPQGKNKSEQVYASFISYIPTSVLNTSLLMATTSFPNQSLPFTYNIKNEGSEVIDQITTTHQESAALSIFTTSTLDQLNNYSLQPGETKLLQGIMTVPEKNIPLNLAIESSVVANNHSIIQSQIYHPIDIIYPKLSSKVRLTSPTAYAENGQKIPLELHWKNESIFNVSQLRMVLEVTPAGVVDLLNTAKENGFKVEKNNLIIDSAARTALSNGGPGAEDTFTFTLKLLPTFKTSGQEKALLTLRPVMQGKIPEVTQQIFEQPGNHAQIPLATQLTMSKEVRYFTPEGDQLGRGPLPPRVGETTKYWIFIKLTNTTNEVVNPQFTATLAPGVSFTGKQSITIGSPLSYNAQNNTLNWRNSYLPANSTAGLYFEVAVTPSASQVGKLIPLVNQTTLTADDDFSKKHFNLILPKFTNSLPANDRGATLGAEVIN